MIKSSPKTRTYPECQWLGALRRLQTKRQNTLMPFWFFTEPLLSKHTAAQFEPKTDDTSTEQDKCKGTKASRHRFLFYYTEFHGFHNLVMRLRMLLIIGWWQRRRGGRIHHFSDLRLTWDSQADCDDSTELNSSFSGCSKETWFTIPNFISIEVNDSSIVISELWQTGADSTQFN